jgi:hypothetical protein
MADVATLYGSDDLTCHPGRPPPPTARVAQRRRAERLWKALDLAIIMGIALPQTRTRSWTLSLPPLRLL